MKKKFLSILLAVFMVSAICPTTVFADYSGDFEYIVLEDGTVAITKYNGRASAVNIPSELDGYTVTAIQDPGFRGCSNLKSVKIPDSITVIWKYAFLETGIFNDPANWDRDAVLYVDNCLIFIKEHDDLFQPIELGTYRIKDNTRLIASDAFSSDGYSGGIYGIRRIEVPANARCLGLSSVIVGRNLEEVYIDENNEYYSNDEHGAVYNKDKTELLFIPNDSDTDPADVKIDTFIVPEGVTTIGPDFSATLIENLYLPSTLTSIEGYLNQDLTSMDGFFLNWSRVNKKVIVDENNEHFCNDENGILYNKDRTELIYCPPGICMEYYAIPQTVTTIRRHAFSCCEIDNLVIPDSVTDIDFAFYNGKIKNLIVGIGVEYFDSMNIQEGFDFYTSISAIYYAGTESEWNDLIEWEIYCYYPKMEMHYSCTGRAKFNDSEDLAIIPMGMCVSELKSNFADYEVDILDKDNTALDNSNMVGTGSVVCVHDSDDNVVSVYTVVLPADVNGDAKVTAADARSALRCAAQIDTLDGVYWTAANVDGNDRLTATDARRILRVAAKLEIL